MARGYVTLVLILALGGCNGFVEKTDSGATLGRIHVSKPAVYTRERLVNDRFREDARLRELLNEERNVVFGAEALRERRRQDILKFGIRLGLGGSPLPTNGAGAAEAGPARTAAKLGEDEAKLPRVTVTPKPEEDRVQEKEAPQKTDVKVSPIDDFRDRLAYREEIRNAIAENALDDAHDLAGNTLYRLKFDATVVPGNDTGAYAIVEVALSAPKEKSDEGLKNLFEEWREALEEDLNHRFLQHLIPYIEGSGMPRDTYGRFQRFAASKGIMISPKQALPRYIDQEVNKFFEDIKVGRDCRKVDEDYKARYAVNPHNRLTIAKNALAEFIIQRYARDKGFGEFADFSTYYLTRVGVEDLVFITVCAKGADKKPLEKFKTKLQERAGVPPSAYAVTPRDLAQRISDVASYRDSAEFVAALSALVGKVGIAAAFDRLSDSLQLVHAIQRQPLVVGYVRSPMEIDKEKELDKTVFGWVLGPRFRIAEDGKSAVFRHTVVQRPLIAVVSVPRWWDSAKIEVTTTWLDNNGGELETKKTLLPQEIELPRRDDDLLTALGDERADGPEIDGNQGVIRVTVGEPADVLLRGRNLWRGTAVTIGANHSKSITVLPNMSGIIAHFDEIQAPAGWPALALTDQGRTPGNVPASVWTSEGRVTVHAELVAKGSGVPPRLEPERHWLAGGESFRAKVSDPNALAGFAGAKLMFRSATAGEGTRSRVLAETIETTGLDAFTAKIGSNVSGLADGAEGVVVLDLVRRPGEDAVPIASPGALVYYGSKPAVTVKPDSLATLPATMRLTFPPNFTKAFLDYRFAPIVAVVEGLDNSPVHLKAELLEENIIGGHTVRTIQLDVPQRDEFLKKAKGKPLSLKLNILGPDAELPAINPVSLNVK